MGVLRPRRRGGRGFTLIEVLVAVAVLAALSVIAWVSLNQMFMTQEIISERHERYRMVRMSMNRMATEISMAYMAGPEHGGEIIPGEESLYDDDEEYQQRQWRNRDPIQFGMIGQSEEIHFTAFGHVRTLEDEPASHHGQIGYFLERGVNEEGRSIYRLMRRSSPEFDSDLSRGGSVFLMLPEVEQLRIEYWDAGDTEFGTSREIAQGRWIREWDTTSRRFAGRLPTRVRISLTVPAQGPRGRSETFVTQTTISMSEVLEY